MMIVCKKLLLIIFSTVSFMDLIALDSRIALDISLEEKNVRLGELFKCSFGHEEKFEDIWNKTLSDIKANKEGKKLLTRLEILSDNLFKLQKIFGLKWDGKIHVTANESGTCFAGRKFTPEQQTIFGLESEQPMALFLNIDLTSKSVAWHKTKGLCSVIPAILKKTDQPFYEIETCIDPYWLTIAHELIHMEHFLMQEMNGYICRYIFDDTLKEVLTPELKERLKPEIVKALQEELERKLTKRDERKINERLEDEIEKICSCREGLIENFSQLNEKIWKKILELRSVCSNSSDIDILGNLFVVVNSQKSIVLYYDFLNSSERLHARYEQNKSISKWNDIEMKENNFLLKICPELASRIQSKGSLTFWENLEERETVIGSRCSELVLRLSEEETHGKVLPIRYLYQDLQTFFIEDELVLLQIINAARNTLRMPLFDSSNMSARITDERVRSFFNQNDFFRIIASRSILSDSICKSYFPEYWYICSTMSKWTNKSEIIPCIYDTSVNKLRKEFRIELLADEKNKKNVELLETNLRDGKDPTPFIKCIVSALEEIVRK